MILLEMTKCASLCYERETVTELLVYRQGDKKNVCYLLENIDCDSIVLKSFISLRTYCTCCELYHYKED